MRLKRVHRGFSLIETAVVLAIIGGIVGIMFAVASAVEHKHSVNLASDELNQISQNMRNLYSGRSTEYTAVGSPAANPTAAAFTASTPTYQSQNVFPADMIRAPGPVPYLPWGGKVWVALAGTAGTNVQYVIRFDSLDADTCTELLTRNSLPGRETNLVQIYVNGLLKGIAFTDTTKPLPFNSNRAVAACSSATANIIDWYYNLNG